MCSFRTFTYATCTQSATAVSGDATYETSKRQVNSLYGAAEVSYNDFLFLNGTIRNDWFSTLSPANRSIVYPSVTASFVFSQAFTASLPSWISFGKVRVAYAEVGSDTDVQPYANNLFYNINAQQFPIRMGQGSRWRASTALRSRMRISGRCGFLRKRWVWS